MKCSHPLNYKSSCATSRFELKTITCDLPFRKKGKWSCCLLHQAAFSLFCSAFTLVDTAPIDIGVFLRCTDGCFTDKLEPTSCHRIQNRTENTRLKLWDVANYTIRHRCSMSDSSAFGGWKTGTPPSMHMLLVAVRMRIELIATDRQSVMLAITPTNRS